MLAAMLGLKVTLAVGRLGDVASTRTNMLGKWVEEGDTREGTLSSQRALPSSNTKSIARRNCWCNGLRSMAHGGFQAYCRFSALSKEGIGSTDW